MSKLVTKNNERLELRHKPSGEASAVKLGVRDSKRVIKLLENPPKANAKLKKVAHGLR